MPIRSTVEAVRQVFARFDGGSRAVILYGPAGSGRSAIARRVGWLWNGPVVRVNEPLPDCDPAATFAGPANDRQNARARGDGLRVVDGLSLDHAGWSALRPETLPAHQRLLVVASTAWWLEFGRYWPMRVAGVATRRIEPDEIAHLINGLRWMKNPNAAGVDPEFVRTVAESTDGLIAEIVRMAS